MEQFTQKIYDKLVEYNEVHEILYTAQNLFNVKLVAFFYLTLMIWIFLPLVWTNKTYIAGDGVNNWSRLEAFQIQINSNMSERLG